jgi:hypothetical protein
MNDDNLDRFVSNVSAVKLGESLGIDAAGGVGIVRVRQAEWRMAVAIAGPCEPAVATPHEPSRASVITVSSSRSIAFAAIVAAAMAAKARIDNRRRMPPLAGSERWKSPARRGYKFEHSARARAPPRAKGRPLQ